MMRRFVATFLIVLLSMQGVLTCPVAHAAVSVQLCDFLIEKGVTYFSQGRLDLAAGEFRKALLANPESREAQTYIALLDSAVFDQNEIGVNERLDLLTKEIEVKSVLDRLDKVSRPARPRKSPSLNREPQDVNQALVDELKNTVVRQKQKKQPMAGLSSSTSNESGVQIFPAVHEEAVEIDHSIASGESQDVLVRSGDRVKLLGRSISRFLAIDPEALKIRQESADTLLITPEKIGTTYLHVWEEGTRRTLKFTTGPRRFEEEIYRNNEEKLRQAQLPESFKVSYSVQGASFMSGDGFGELQRQSHTLSYNSSIIGETPYGNFDTAVQASSNQQKSYRVSNLRMGLTNGHFDQIKDITIRGFDFTPTFSAFGFPAADLRGAMIEAPMFSKSLHYNAFWGALPLGDFTQLSTSSTSGLVDTKKAWLEGLGVKYKIGKSAEFRSFYAHSYGSERTSPVLTSDTAGFGLNHYMGIFDWGAEMATDMLDHISYTGSANFNLSKVRVGLSMTDTSKDFASLLGGSPSSGATSGSLTVNYRPLADLSIVNTFSGRRDKVFGNPDNPSRPNYTSTTRVNWTFDPHSEIEVGYALDDQLGSNTPSVVETKELILRKKFYLLRKLSTFINFQNRKSKSFLSPAQDYNNNRVLAGLSFRVIGELYAFYHREFNFLRSKFSGEEAVPVAQEMGLSLYRQVFSTPLYFNGRISFRDEQNTESTLSYLSGEDRFEAEAELTYKFNPDSEGFMKGRIVNVWAEKSGIAKHSDFEFSWGLRLLWDTGLRWPSTGSFSGYVYYDLNSDGRRQAGEKGVAGVRVEGPDGKSVVTDELGFYKISGITGRTANIGIDLKTLPRGYNLTSQGSVAMDVVHRKIKRINFGVATRSEISGLVFHDKNNNGQYDLGEEPVAGVAVILDDQRRAASTIMGEYMFRKLSPGDHVLKLDLKTVPIAFIPKVAIVKKVKILEGATFVYHIPLAETK